MINFIVDQQTCTQCGLCVADCPARIISMKGDDFPAIAPDKESSCYKCQHCLAICPTGSVSILGRNPENSLKLAGNLPSPDQMETLIKGRRSVRRYKEENLDPDLLQKLLEVAWHAPTGVNTRQVRFTVVENIDTMNILRTDVYAGLSQLVKADALPEGLKFFSSFVQAWEEQKIDIVFRGAPHLLLTSVPQNVASPTQDTIIALSYFELFAQANGVGTVWCGLAKWALIDLLPEMRKRLGIPDDHQVGYAMVFGKPVSRYARTVQHGPAIIHRVS